MLYYMNNGHELIKIDENTNKVANLHTKESNQVAYRPLYIIQEDGTIMYEDAQKLKVKAGDVVMVLDAGTPIIIKDKAFALLVEMYFEGLKNNLTVVK